MNTELFIARRINKNGDKARLSTPTIRISVAGIAIGLSVMILTIAIVNGFKKEIRNKISGLNGHIVISSFENNNSWENTPVQKEQSFYPDLVKSKGINHIQVYATKAGIIKTKEDVEGVLLKGIGKDYNWSYLESQLLEGEVLELTDSSKTNNIMISDGLAKRLRLKLGDKVTTYFIQQPPRVRKFTITGIYQNSIQSFNNMIYCDIGHIQKLNGWSQDQVGGFEVLIDDFDELDKMWGVVNDQAGLRYYDDGSSLLVETVKHKYSSFFNWLSLSDTTAYFLLVLMILVAIINMVTGVLILIIEKTRMIGILKSIGTENWSIRKIFLYNAFFIISKGIIIGNLVGLGLCFLQQQTGLVRLDPDSYYVSLVPIDIQLMPWLILNLASIVIIVISMIVPSYLVTRISPASAIRFE